MFFADRLQLDAPRRTADGYVAVRANAARTGAYQYTGREVDPDNAHGLRDQATVNVLRDDAEVFDQRSVHSFMMKPITNDHPAEAVTADNWKRHARGAVAGAMRDGDHLAFDLILMDAAAIADVDAGKRELSNGYSCQLEFGDFAAADGTKCQARQTNIVGNHVALVDKGRAGTTCRIGDAAPCTALPSMLFDREPQAMAKIIMIDGLSVDVSNADTAEATIKTLVGARDAATAKITGFETQIATLTTDKATLTAENVTLKAQVADAASPAKLRAAAASYGVTVDKAKALGVAVTDAMDEPAIQRAVVLAKVGDAAKDWTDAQMAASFASLTMNARATANDTVVSIVPAGSVDHSTVRDAARAARYA